MNLGRKTEITPRQFPKKSLITGRHVTLEPLAKQHQQDLWDTARDADSTFTYLRYGPFRTEAELDHTLSDLSSRTDQPFWAVRPTSAGLAQGWLSLCDVYPQDAAIEIGSIWFGPALQKTRAGTEALFLLMQKAMDDLRYERLVWRCQAQNAGSVRAAERLGFTYEGTWRRAAIVDQWQRDVAWFSILADEWPERREALIAWLSDENFDKQGKPRKRLAAFRPSIR